MASNYSIIKKNINERFLTPSEKVALIELLESKIKEDFNY